jgi:hypothetical protein
MDLNGSLRSVMGCRQRIRLGYFRSLQTFDELRHFVHREFLVRADWMRPNGTPGGFCVSKSLYKTTDGSLGSFRDQESNGPVDWREIRQQYQWVMFRLDLRDFILECGPFSKQIKQAVLVTAQPEFCSESDEPTSGERCHVSVGYSFVPFAPIKNFFGFGPGKFGAAIKTFRFVIESDGVLAVEMVFAAAPRCEKVFDFASFLPDPVYGGAALLERLSFGRWKAGPFRTRLDSQMLAQHCRVHQTLMEGIVANLSTDQSSAVLGHNVDTGRELSL